MGLNEPESKTCCGDIADAGGPDRIRREVAGQYDNYAQQPNANKVGSFAEIAGYGTDDIRSLPETAVLNSLSCRNTTSAEVIGRQLESYSVAG